MLVPSGAKSRPPCASKLCGPVPKYEFREEEERGGAGRGFSPPVGGSNGVNTRPTCTQLGLPFLNNSNPF